MTIPKFLHETSSEELERLMAVNLKAVFWACKYAIPHMKKQGGGAILTTASKAGLVAQAGSAGYCASKFAVIGLMQAVALEYAEDNIRANSLCPGIIQTPMYEFFVNSQSDPQASRCWHEQAQPLGRVGTAEECAYAALYLCSDEASFTTGVALLVDGGFTAR
jgi:NAD(P)-dependent dehydrogenase (short-subunit alcohol dehydrogenase family)